MMTDTFIVEILQDIRKDMAEMKSILAVNTKELEIHIKRSNALEKKLELLENDVTRLRGFFTIAGWLVGATATVLTLLERFGKL